MAYYTEEQKKKIKETFEWAKKNPNDPKSKEIQKRILEGKMNFELQAVGFKPVPVKQPKVNLEAAMNSVTQQPGLQSVPVKPEDKAVLPRIAKDIPSDVVETAKGMTQAFTKGLDNAWEILKDDDRTVAQKLLGALVQPTAGVFNAAGEGIIGAGKLVLTDEAEKMLGNAIKNAAIKATETEAAKYLIPRVQTWYNSLDDDDKFLVDQMGGIAQVVSEALVIGKAGKPLVSAGKVGMEMVGEGLEQGVKAGKEGAGFAMKEGAESLATQTIKKAPERLAKQEEVVNEAMGRLLQAGNDTDAIEAAARSLRNIDTTDVKSYTDLNIKIRDKQKALAQAQDTYLDQFDEKFTPQMTGKYTKVGNKTVTENPVVDALDGLEDAYRRGGEPVKAEEIVQLRSKFETEGLTVKELNLLARRYGIEFKDRAFTKMGDPKPGYAAESFESTRRGLKDVVRERLPDDKSKLLDKEMSDLYTVYSATEAMEGKVAKLYQRITNRTLAQKAGGAVASILDFATAGGLRGFIAKLLPSNIGNKAMNSIEIEKEIQKNLKELDNLMKIEDDVAFAKAFDAWYKMNASDGVDLKKNSQGGYLDLSSGEQIKNIDAQIKQLNKELEIAYKDSNGKTNTNIKSMEKKVGALYRERDKIDSSFKQSETSPTTPIKGEETKTCVDCLSIAEKNLKEKGLPIKKGVLINDAKNPEDALERALQVYEMRSQSSSPNYGQNTHAWNISEGKIVDDHKGGQTTAPEFGYVSESQILKYKLLKNWADLTEDSAPTFSEKQIETLLKDTSLPRPQRPVTLYRGTIDGENIVGRPSSWTYVKEVAEEHAEVNGGGVIKRKINPNEVIVSLSDLPISEQKKYGFPLDEEEVIVFLKN